MSEQKLKIAVVGAGVAGITAAHILQRRHSVTLFEKNNYIGGHTNTVVIEKGPDAGTAVDTGFIVLNDKTYPTFHRLLSQLSVSVRKSDMSFGFHCEKSGLQYSGRNLRSLFAQKKNIVNLSFLRMLYDIKRFGRIARMNLQNGMVESRSLGQYAQDGGFSKSFLHNYLIPMGAAIWSTPAREMFNFPAQTFLHFFHNHGLLSLDIPQWQTVDGGSHAYVKAFLKQFQGKTILNRPVQGVVRDEDAIRITMQDGDVLGFDRVVLACHADESLQLLNDPTPNEKKLLGVWKYTKNNIVLHADSSVMPANSRAWASWNYTREWTEDGSEPLSLTYHMNRLQGLETAENYFVTLNRQKPIGPKSVIMQIVYTHPQYDFQSLALQKELPKLNGCNNTFFCGSYFGYGFHEDAVKSGVEVGRYFGMEL